MGFEGHLVWDVEAWAELPVEAIPGLEYLTFGELQWISVIYLLKWLVRGTNNRKTEALSHRMYQLNSFRKSTSSQNRQLVVPMSTRFEGDLVWDVERPPVCQEEPAPHKIPLRL